MKSFALTLLLALPALAHTPPLEQLPDVALAQAPAAAESIGDRLLGFVSPGGVATLLGIVASAICGFSFMTASRKKRIALAAYHAFHIVEDVGNEIEGDDVFDKGARYLKELDAYMVANGWRPLKPGETEAARLTASALHGAEVAKAKVLVAAAEAAASP